MRRFWLALAVACGGKDETTSPTGGTGPAPIVCNDDKCICEDAPCEANCAAIEACEVDCVDTTSCDLACNDAPACTLVASGGPTTVACAGASTCNVECSFASTCSVDCQGSSNCYVHCPDFACTVTNCGEGCTVECGERPQTPVDGTVVCE